MNDHQTFYREVGRRVRSARKKCKLTQQGLAESVSLTRTSITNIEKGRQKLLLHTLADLGEALGVEASALLPETGVEPDLEDTLKDRTTSEKEWIKSAVLAARKGKSHGGS